MKRFKMVVRTALLVAMLCGCSEEVGGSGVNTASGGGTGGMDVANHGTPVTVDVPAEGRVVLDLDGPAVVSEAADWELALSSYDIFTNSGVSGPGSGGGFGPLSAAAFLLDESPEVPFVLEDRTGGALLGWYAYDGTTHALWSRYHVYGIRDGEDDYKLQILGYYGELQGAPVSALYQLRWAKVSSAGVGATQTLLDVDGSAGGLSGGPNDPGECLDLGSGARTMLTVDEALVSHAWHVCFRRDAISVNGELGGPRGVGAVDVTLQQDPTEAPVDVVKTRTAASELAAFEAVDADVLTDPALVYRGDRVVSAFDTHWYQAGAEPTPTDASWYVRSSDGARGFLLFFESFQNATANTPGRLGLRVKQVGAAE